MNIKNYKKFYLNKIKSIKERTLLIFSELREYGFFYCLHMCLALLVTEIRYSKPKKRSAVYSLLRDRLFLLDDLKIESRLFLNDPEEYDSKVMNKIEKHNPKKIIGQFIQFTKNSVSVREWKSEIQKWNEKAGLPFGAIMQSLRLALVGNLSGPDLFDICEVLGNEITLRRLEKFINH